MRRAVLALAIAACGTPTPQLRLGLSGLRAQTCPSTDCTEVPMVCDAVMSIRMVDPADATKVMFKQCERVQPDRKTDMCSLRSVDLKTALIPVRELDVQIAVYPAARIPNDPDTGEPLCPDTLEFSAASGFPVEQASAPALGGHTYYHPGDETVDVTLGCTDLSAINDACTGTITDSVSASVIDFDTRLPVTVGPQGVADHLWVSVGEPHIVDGLYVLNPRDAVALRLADETRPTWRAPIALSFTKYACVEVLEDIAQTTPSLRCQQTVSGALPELGGMLLSRGTLQNIVKSLGLTEFPDQGITIGMVVDSASNGAPGYTVAPNGTGTVTYLSTTGGLGGSRTSESGIFVSSDAPFGTKFSASGPNATQPAIGGLVAGKVTIVVVPVSSQASH
jgi:hypothetical protein